MAYEQLDLLNSFLTNRIFLARPLKNNLMSDNRADFTEKAKKAVATWFLLKLEGYSVSYCAFKFKNDTGKDLALIGAKLTPKQIEKVADYIKKLVNEDHKND